MNRELAADLVGWVKTKSRNSRWYHRVGLLGIVGLAALPAALTPTQLAPFIGVLYLMVFAMSWDFISGYTGQLNLGHALFFGIGGYTSTILNLQHGIPPFVSIVAGTLLAAVIGLLIGIPALRAQGVYLALLTLIAPFILRQLLILFNDELLVEAFGITIPLAPNGLGGDSGFSFSPDALVGTRDAAILTVGSFRMQIIGNYYLALVVFLVCLSILLLITRSQIGDILTAIRESEETVSAVGINPAKFKLFAFVLSGLFGGLAGAFFVHSPSGFPQPALLLDFQISINVIIMTVLGGIGTIVGAAVGTLLFEIIQQTVSASFLQFTIPILGYTPSDLQPVPVIAISVFILYHRPEGIVPSVLRFVAQRDIETRVRDALPESLPDVVKAVKQRIN